MYNDFYLELRQIWDDVSSERLSVDPVIDGDRRFGFGAFLDDHVVAANHALLILNGTCEIFQGNSI